MGRSPSHGPQDTARPSRFEEQPACALNLPRPAPLTGCPAPSFRGQIPAQAGEVKEARCLGPVPGECCMCPVVSTNFLPSRIFVLLRWNSHAMDGTSLKCAVQRHLARSRCGTAKHLFTRFRNLFIHPRRSPGPEPEPQPPPTCLLPLRIRRLPTLHVKGTRHHATFPVCLRSRDRTRRGLPVLWHTPFPASSLAGRAGGAGILARPRAPHPVSASSMKPSGPSARVRTSASASERGHLPGSELVSPFSVGPLGGVHSGRFISGQVVTLDGPLPVAAHPRTWLWPGADQDQRSPEGPRCLAAVGQAAYPTSF